MLGLTTIRLGHGDGWVLAVSGDLDASMATAVTDGALGCAGGRVVVDLLRAGLVDLDALEGLVAALDVTFVADRRMREALDVIALHRHVDIESTLAAALS